MADFMQNGCITTLHRLTQRPVEDLEAELQAFSRQRAMALILPALFSELEGRALPRIVDELRSVGYVGEVVVGLDRADRGQFAEARRFFGVLPQPTRILWQDGPRLRELDGLLAERGLAPGQPGKGRNVWYCFGYVLARGQADAVALHDCDILTYDRSLLARLFYPIVNPGADFKFCKGYYARIAGDRLSGRVTRLLVAPLLRALNRVLGPLDYLDFLGGFRYPLSGEFAVRTDELAGLRIPGDWGLEVGLLSEVYRNLSRRQVCQVDIADRYDHKHQDLSRDDPDTGLARMSMDISRSIYRKLATEGVTLGPELFRTIKATYYRTALDMLGQYACDAQINGLRMDLNAEEEAIELFAHSVISAGERFLANPMDAPFIPNWQRIFSAVPEMREMLVHAVEADNE
jgi:glucosyl-3-phosphoglycerate synthase